MKQFVHRRCAARRRTHSRRDATSGHRSTRKGLYHVGSRGTTGARSSATTVEHELFLRLLRVARPEVRLEDARLGADDEPPPLRDRAHARAACPKECASSTAATHAGSTRATGRRGKGHLFRHAFFARAARRTSAASSARAAYVDLNPSRDSLSPAPEDWRTGAATAATLGLEHPRPFHRPAELSAAHSTATSGQPRACTYRQFVHEDCTRDGHGPSPNDGVDATT